MRTTTRRTNYSPVRRMNSNHGHHRKQHQDHELEYTPSNNYRQEEEGEEDLDDDHHHHHHHKHPHQQVTGQLADEEANRQQSETTSSLEEVYLCYCCGLTKELDPAMKYMPVFRSLFFLFNFLVFASGLANLGMGLWFRIDPKVYEIHKYIETQNFTIAGWIMLFGGFLACLMALIGFTATMRQAIGLLLFYLIVIVILTISFIGTIVLLTVFGLGRQLESFLTKEIYEQIRRRSMNADIDLFMSTDATQFMDFVQVKMRCCGATDFRDYQKLGMVIPTTCYTIAGNYINAPGCGRAIRELFDLRAGLAAGFTTASVVAQMITIILAGLMICSIYNWRANPRPIPGGRGRSNEELDYSHQDDSTQLKQLYLERPASRISSIAV